MLFFGKPKSYLGIDIGHAGVKVVELKKEKGRPVLFTYGYSLKPWHRETKSDSVPTAQEQDGLAQMISSVCRQARVTTRTAVVSIPASHIFHALVTLPIAQKDDLNRMLESEVKKLLPYPLTDAQLDYQVVTKDEAAKTQRVLVSAVPKAIVSAYAGAAKAAGITLDALEPESVALSRSLIGRDTATALLVDIGDTRTNFFIVDNTYPITQQSIEIGAERLTAVVGQTLGIDVAVSETVKKNIFDFILSRPEIKEMTKQSFLNMAMPVIEPIVKEIEYSMELYTRQSTTKNKIVEKIIFTGGGSFFPYLTDYVSELFKIKTYVGDPWGRVVFPDGLQPVLRALAPRMAVAIGLALRNVV